MPRTPKPKILRRTWPSGDLSVTVVMPDGEAFRVDATRGVPETDLRREVERIIADPDYRRKLNNPGYLTRVIDYRASIRYNVCGLQSNTPTS